MVLCLIPVGALAADNDSSATVNPVTGREQGPEGDIDVSVMVYGDVITNLTLQQKYSFSTLGAASKNAFISSFKYRSEGDGGVTGRRVRGPTAH